jgi:hypothetical protein
MLVLSILFNIDAWASNGPKDSLSVDFLGYQVSVHPFSSTYPSKEGKNVHQLSLEYERWIQSNLPSSLTEQLRDIRKSTQLSDWFYYQLIRKIANTVLPKQHDYVGYTICKWFLLNETGYDAAILTSSERIMLYIRSSDMVYNQPVREINGYQYTSLNFHDYGYTSEDGVAYTAILYSNHSNRNDFSFKIDQLPQLPESAYETKDLSFTYGGETQHLALKVSSVLKGIYTNYPVTEYANQFNIPINKETESSLINALVPKITKLNQKQGLEYLLNFTRYSFDFDRDANFFGREKRLSPEETILYEKSDCEDRAALFFYLVKKIYNLPMIVLSYPSHINIGIAMEKPVGKGIAYNGKLYSICEPTPQRKEYGLGQMDKTILKEGFEIVHEYLPN